MQLAPKIYPPGHPEKPASGAVVNALRVLAMDAVQVANSGHPGMPMGMAEIAEVLWRRHLRHNPANPHWVDRDRFVLSNGHGGGTRGSAAGRVDHAALSFGPANIASIALRAP